MIKLYRAFVFYGLFIIGFSSCKKKETPISSVPEIGFENISPITIKQNTDSILLRISYKDGDGDLGENIDSVRNVFVTDSRNNITYKYRLKQLSPSNSKIAISGFVNIVLGGLAIQDVNSMQESATFSIFIKDRSGNQSNIVTSSAVTITK